MAIGQGVYILAERNGRISFANVIMCSIRALQERPKRDFNGELLVRDALTAMGISEADALPV